MKALIMCLLIALIMTVPVLSVPTTLDYQGRLTDATGDNVSDGLYDLTITIYDAATGGSSLWTEVRSIAVTDGLFAVNLGSVTPIPEALFKNSDLWLGIQVGAEAELVPRTKLTSVPYAFNSAYSDTAAYAESSAVVDDGDWTPDGDNIHRLTGNVGIGTASPFEILSVMGSEAQLFSWERSGISDRWALGANSDGGYIRNQSKSDIPLFFGADGNVGIGTTSPTENLSVLSSDAQIISWEQSGVSDRWALGANSDGGYIRNQSNSDIPLFFGADGNVGIGTTMPSYPLEVSGTGRFESLLPGNTTFFNGEVITFLGGGGTPAARIERVTGDHLSISTVTGNNHIILMPGGSGNVGIGTTGPVTKLQVNATTTTVGIKIHAQTGDNNSDTPYLLFSGGYKSYNGAMIRGTGDDTFGRTGLSFYAGWSTGTHGDDPGITDIYERMRITSSGNVGIGTTTPTEKLYVVGNFCATGSKNAVVPTSQGMTKVYSEESAGVWFTDYGEEQLVDGKCTIRLDPLFLETVTISDEYPMMIFVEEYGDCNDLYVIRGESSFEVIEKNNGNSNVTFGYRIVAKRKGYESDRLESQNEIVLNQ